MYLVKWPEYSTVHKKRILLISKQKHTVKVKNVIKKDEKKIIKSSTFTHKPNICRIKMSFLYTLIGTKLLKNSNVTQC